jgi:hypothetical protein
MAFTACIAMLASLTYGSALHPRVPLRSLRRWVRRSPSAGAGAPADVARLGD